MTDPQQLGDHVLQEIDGGIFSLLLVAHLRIAHEPAHGGRWAGDGVTEEIDLYHSMFSILLRPSRKGMSVAAAQMTNTAAPAAMSSGVIGTGSLAKR